MLTEVSFINEGMVEKSLTGDHRPCDTLRGIVSEKKLVPVVS